MKLAAREFIRRFVAGGLALGVGIAVAGTERGGVSFDFAKLSAERFRDDPHAVNLAASPDRCETPRTLVGVPDRRTGKGYELKVPVKLSDGRGTVVRSSFQYRSHPVPGKRGRTIVFFRSPGLNAKGYVYQVLAETDDFWHYFSKEVALPAGCRTFELNPVVEGAGTFEIRNVKVTEVKPDPSAPDIEIMLTPHGYTGGDFAVSRNGLDIVNFQWRQAKGAFDGSRRHEFVATVPAGFELVAPLNARGAKWTRMALADGGEEVRFATAQTTRWTGSRFDWWRRLGFMVTSGAAVGTRGTARFWLETDGRIASNVATAELFVIPEIPRVKPAKRFLPGVALACPVGLFTDDPEIDRRYADFMVGCGVRFIKSFALKPGPELGIWREAGIRYVVSESPILNGYSVVRDPQPPPEEKFIARNPKRGHWLSHSICPVAIYREKPFFRTNILERLRVTHEGMDGSYANWEPFFYREEGCMCRSCLEEFAKWAKHGVDDVAVDWPKCIDRKEGRFGREIVGFRAWQMGEVVRVLQRHAVAATGGEKSLGLIPAVLYEQMTRDWVGKKDFGEYDTLAYGRFLRWILPWGPYSGVWDAAAPFAGAGKGWMRDFSNARDTIVQARRDYPGVKMIAYPHGLQETSWVIEPEILGLNLNAYFFCGWDAALVYFFPMGYDARYWTAFADASRNAAKYEDFVFGGRRIDGEVRLEGAGELVGPVAYEFNGRRIVAVFNYAIDNPAEFTLCAPFLSGGRKLRVPAARMEVFEF